MHPSRLWAGIDVGSTTLKIAIIEPDTKELLHAVYRRHGAKQTDCARELLSEAHAAFPDADFEVAVCGSGGRIIAKAIDAHYIQEVVANSLAIREFFPATRVAIELGGQDAKVVFFHHDEISGKLMASDMRMNGSCAGGTGAFIDEVASLLKITAPEFNGYAERGETVYPISGRCGVFAKTDIQPLLNQGVSKEDIALSTFHAIAKQTIGGLAQGMEIVPPIIFEGGPLTFNPALIRVFAERLGLADNEIILPDRPEIIVAFGTALSIGVMFTEAEKNYDRERALAALARPQAEFAEPGGYRAAPLFESEEEKNRFHERHPREEFQIPDYPAGTELEVYLGIDAGSTTSKFILLDRNEEVVYRFYANNSGAPMKIMQQGLLDCYRSFEERGVSLKILGAGTTGYGEGLFAAAFKADYHTVETVAHAEAALKFRPEASFILDIGGQDMKAINLAGGIVTGIVLNEACSAGCGSFIETYANSLEIPVAEIAEQAFTSPSPAKLGSRCTIFMNSSIITEQKNGKTPADIMAGLCKSIIENVFTKVIRMANLDALGDSIVVQGGTFKNDAVLRAFEQFSGKSIVRAPFPGEMGAVGIALLTKQRLEEALERRESRFIGREGLAEFSFSKEPGYVCPYCSNNCNRTLVTFADGSTFITGNRCERGEIIGDVKDPSVKERLKQAGRKLDAVPDMMRRRKELLFADYEPRVVSPPKEYTIGLPRVLEFWNSMPFWRSLFTALGFRVVLSRESNQKLYEEGLQFVPSDTACFPGKVAHGHLMDLIAKKVDRIVMPMMLRMESENKQVVSNYLCSVVQGYPLILRESHEPAAQHGIPMDTPAFHWYDEYARDKQLIDYFAASFNIPASLVRQAIKEADRAQDSFAATLQREGGEIIAAAEEKGEFAVVLAGRPYHNDFLVNHDLSRFFTRQAIPVLTIDSLPGFNRVDLTGVRGETVINFHVRMFEAAIIAAENPALELAQIVSFGCGHDAVISDEIVRIMKEGADKDPLILKLDESDVPGPLNIRVKSFIETVKAKRERLGSTGESRPLKDPFPAKYESADRTTKTILVPTLSPTFTVLASAVLEKEGYKAMALPVAEDRAVELGKKYVHNDMCFPAQLNIGEALAVIEAGERPEEFALGLAHFECDCRLAQYATIARKALDDAGYPQVPIITTGEDKKGMHPGLKLGLSFQWRMLWAILVGDALDGMARRVRPYEREAGATDAAHHKALYEVRDGFDKGISAVLKRFRTAVEEFNRIEVVEGPRKPRVFVIGEILLNYHPKSNAFIEEYLEKNGMEVVMPPMIDVFKKDAATVRESMRRFHVRLPFIEAIQTIATDKLIDGGLNYIESINRSFRFYEPKDRYDDLAKNVDGLVDKVFNSGKGWLIPADIVEQSKRGVNSFIILQPFGCLPNHITGRGIVKSVKKQFPHIQVLSLDYDPDTSLANIENRLQMLIINARELEKERNAPEKGVDQ